MLVSRRLLPQSATLCPPKRQGLRRRLLPQVNAVHPSESQGVPERLLSEELPDPAGEQLRTLVHLRPTAELHEV
jgi:hypothetical protein